MVTILCGTNTYLLRRDLKRLVDDFVAENGDLALERLDGESADYNRVMEALTSPPFLSSKKLVVLRDASSNKSLTEHIAEILGASDDITDLVIVEGKVDKRSVFYKALKAQKGFKEHGEQDDQALTGWLVQEAKDQGGELSQSDARYLVDKLGPVQSLLANELEKLILYTPKITRTTIDLLVEASPRSTIFEMLDAAFAGNQKRALGLYDEQRRQRVEPQAMLGLISWQLHALALVKVAGNRSPSEIARDGGISPYVVNKSISTAKRLTAQQLRDLVHDTLMLDIRLKSEPIDADSALQNLLISIANS
jgi:DNA polymerase-3 subunit delta